MLEAHGRARPQRRGEARRAVPLLDLAPQVDTFLDEVLEGLSRPRPRTLPCKFFYDRRGSQLFDQICELPEYYLTRTELEIMRARAGAMAAWVGPAAMVIEFGSGSSVKTRLLLDHLACPSAYVPVDISKQHLLEAAEQLAARYPDVEVLPVCADFTRRLELPTPTAAARRRVIYFPGSTIGNFAPAQTVALLRQIAALCGRDGGLLIGVDLKKDPRTLERAYNDAAGVTAAFNLNLLARINRELGGDFPLAEFTHTAVYDADDGRVEMRLVSRRPQVVTIQGRRFAFDAGEYIVTEHSHKYALAEFAELGAEAGFRVAETWTDAARKFGVLALDRVGA